jgi:predicted RNase H-like HicB family nuclease
MSQYLIVIEPTETGFSAYAPDLPGCVSTGGTRREVEQNMKEAIALHIDGMREEGLPIPQPRSQASLCTVTQATARERSRAGSERFGAPCLTSAVSRVKSAAT